MGNTADLAMVQKTIIDILHKEGKSQRVITERGGCHGTLGSAVERTRSGSKCRLNWFNKQKGRHSPRTETGTMKNTDRQSGGSVVFK